MTVSADTFDFAVTAEVVPAPNTTPDAPATGSLESPVWLVLPSADDAAFRAGDPLGGAHGYALRESLERGGLNLDDLHVRTLHQAPLTNAQAMSWTWPTQGEVEGLEQLMARHNPELVLLAGEACLKPMTGQYGIDKWRGSIIQSQTGHWVLPVYDPLRLYYEHELRFLTVVDARKVAIRHHAFNPPAKDYTIAPSYDEAVETLLYLRDECEQFAFDIETWRGHSLYCIGFADGPNCATTIPFISKHNSGYHYWSEAQERELMLLLSEVMSNPKTAKIAQNALFDMSFLWDHGRILTQGRVWDTMINHHLLYPDLKKGLDTLTSIYTLDPYYKDEGKVWKDGSISEEQFFTYNCKDADTTYRCHIAIMAQLQSRKQMPVAEHTADLLMRVSFTFGLRGLGINRPRMQELATNMDARVAKVEAVLRDKFLDIELNSSAQMKAYLYGEAGLDAKQLKSRAAGKLNPVLEGLIAQSPKLPPQKKLAKQKDGKKKQVVTADEKALVNLKQTLLNKHYAEGGKKWLENRRLIAFLSLVLFHREKAKLSSTYFHCKLSPDGRMRSTFSLAGPPTGRFASKQYYDKTGANEQNLTKVAKEYIVPLGAEQ